MINNRQAGRRRGRGGNNGGGGGGNAPRQGGQGRPDNGNRIDSRARGNAAQLLEKYKNLASDAQRQGDRVNTEYYLQFADHYFRVIADQRGRFEDQQPRRQQADFDGEGDEDFGDEGEPIRTGEQSTASVARQDRYERQDRPEREDRPERQDRGERPYRAEGQERAERPYRAEGQDRPERQDRAERPRPERAARPDGERPRRFDRDDRPQRASEAETEIAGQRRADPPVAGEDLAARAEAVLEADAPLQNDVAPRRRGRPRRDAAIEAAVAVDGSHDAPESNGVDADRLPPSLGIFAANDAAEGEAPRPRRRRTRAVATGDVPTS